jgi:hypothetical protein
VFSFDFQALFAALAHPVVPALDEGVIVDPVTGIGGAKITLHD